MSLADRQYMHDPVESDARIFEQVFESAGYKTQQPFEGWSRKGKKWQITLATLTISGLLGVVVYTVVVGLFTMLGITALPTIGHYLLMAGISALIWIGLAAYSLTALPAALREDWRTPNKLNNPVADRKYFYIQGTGVATWA